jgi:fucose 4-O-acetylase-like acetyltransferase
MTLSDQAPAAKSRLIWIDTARGLGIILVVYGHVLRGQVSAKMLAPTPLLLWQDHLIYAFHMPFFFFLSGLFAGSRAPIGTILRRRFVTIVYPYLLWSIIQVLLSIAAYDYANRPQTLDSLVQIAITPVGQFWFLYVLAILQLLALLPRPLFLAIIPFGIFAACFWGTGWMPMRAGWDLPFFAAGLVLGARGLDAQLESRRRAFLCLLIGGIVFASVLYPVFTLHGRALIMAKYVPATAGIVAMLGLSRLIDDRVRLLPILGVASLAIFVLHVICAGAVRSGAARLFPHHPVMLVALVTLGGLFIPLAAFRAAARVHLTPWLGLGFAPASPERIAATGDSAHEAS